MNLTDYGIRVIKLAGKQCNIVSKTRRIIEGTTQLEDIITPVYANVDCRFQQKPTSKYSQIAQHARASEITGVFYIPAKINGVIPEINQQENYIEFEGGFYEILLIEKPSEPVYIKLYIKKDGN